MKPKANPAKAAAKPAPTTVAAKPARVPKSTPVKRSAEPAPPAAPPPPRDELVATRDVARLLRYGESFGPHRIDVRWLPLQLQITSGALALFDPAAPKAARVLARPCGSGHFRVMLSLARDGVGVEQLAALVIHVGRPPIARWTVAHEMGAKRPASVDAIPRIVVGSGWLGLVDGTGPIGALEMPAAPASPTPTEVPLPDGRRALALHCGKGEYVAYWAIDATDKPVCLVVDFDPFTQKEWKARPPA